MLGKLLKNELKSYRFSFGIVFLTAIIVTLFMKIGSMLPYQTGAREVIQILSAYGYYYIIMLMNVAALVLVVIRFYSTMAGDRGYLTWTLPVTSGTHIWAKLIGAMLMRLLTLAAAAVCILIFYAGRYWIFYSEMVSDLSVSGSGHFIIDAFREMFQELFGQFEIKYMVSILLILLNVVLSMALPLLLLYFCIAIGQLFGKWRILASVGCYFGIFILFQILMVVGMLALAIGSTEIHVEFLRSVDDFLKINGMLVVVALVQAAAASLFFALTNWIFKRHLNLE